MLPLCVALWRCVLLTRVPVVVPMFVAGRGEVERSQFDGKCGKAGRRRGVDGGVACTSAVANIGPVVSSRLTLTVHQVQQDGVRSQLGRP